MSEFCIQNFGCKAEIVTGDERPDLPVCLSQEGTVIEGCNRAQECLQVYLMRLHAKGLHAESMKVGESGVVSAVKVDPIPVTTAESETAARLSWARHFGPDIVA